MRSSSKPRVSATRTTNSLVPLDQRADSSTTGVQRSGPARQTPASRVGAGSAGATPAGRKLGATAPLRVPGSAGRSTAPPMPAEPRGRPTGGTTRPASGTSGSRTPSTSTANAPRRTESTPRQAFVAETPPMEMPGRSSQPPREPQKSSNVGTGSNPQPPRAPQPPIGRQPSDSVSPPPRTLPSTTNQGSSVPGMKSQPLASVSSSSSETPQQRQDVSAAPPKATPVKLRQQGGSSAGASGGIVERDAEQPWPSCEDSAEEKAFLDGNEREARGGQFFYHFRAYGFYGCRRCRAPVARAESKINHAGGYAAFATYCVSNLLCHMRVGYEETVFDVRCLKCSANLGWLTKENTATGDCLRLNSRSIWFSPKNPPATSVLPPDSTFDAEALTADADLSSGEEDTTVADDFDRQMEALSPRLSRVK